MKPGEATSLQVYDTLTRELRHIHASDGRRVRIYCCGPTVYRDAHVGNLRTFLLSDLVTRTLQFAGFAVELIQNITDVGHMSEDFEEDKILAQSRLERRDPFEIAREYEAKFHADCLALNITPAAHYPRASECIELMVEHIQRLIEMDLAYVGADASVYFDATKFPTYGALSGNRLDALQPGHRYEFTEGGAKRFHADWALWKAAGERREMIWQTPWGPGFPGWHIECSAMSLRYLEGHVDLHIGGIDLRFPHHENERAQSNPIVGAEAVSTWLHGEHLLFEGRKMSKSAGNVVLIRDVLARGLDPLAVRFCFMENRYRSQMDLSWNSITAAHNLLQRWRANYQAWSASSAEKSSAVLAVINSIKSDFEADLDTPRALIRLREFERGSASAGEKRALFEAIDPLLGFELLKIRQERPLSEAAAHALAERATARANRDFARSDELRAALEREGIEVRDTASGQSWSWRVN